MTTEIDVDSVLVDAKSLEQFVVTVFTTLGPVTYMYEVPSTMAMKSVIAGE